MTAGGSTSDPRGFMLCCVEIACLIWGIVILATGKVPLSSTREVRGGPAYAIGLLLLAVFPLAFTIGLVIGFRRAQQGAGPQFGQFDWSVVLIDLGAILVCVIPAFIIALVTAKPKRRTRRRTVEEDDYDDYDRPVRRRRRLDEEEEEEEERARRPRRDEDEDDFRPRRRRDKDGDDDDDRRRRRRGDDLDDRAQ